MSLAKKYWIIIVVLFVLSMLIKPALCFLILGILLLYISFEAIYFQKLITKKGINWTGKIIKYQSDNDGYKTPIIEFTTKTGEIIKEQPFIYSSTDLSKFRTYSNLINQSVPILYYPDNPKKFIIKNETGFNYFVFTICIIGGLIFIAVGISWLVGYIKM